MVTMWEVLSLCDIWSAIKLATFSYINQKSSNTTGINREDLKHFEIRNKIFIKEDANIGSKEDRTKGMNI